MTQKHTLPTEGIDEMVELTPFKEKDLAGQTFAKGNMLGGATPIVEAGKDAPWHKK